MNLFFVSCSEDEYYRENVELQGNYWDINSPEEFLFDIIDVETNYDIYLTFRYTNEYEYQRIFLTYVLEEEKKLTRDSALVDFYFFHEKTGKPLGSGLGDIFDIRYQLISGYSFKQPGKYRLRVNQFMRDERLENIKSVGIVIKESLPDAQSR